MTSLCAKQEQQQYSKLGLEKGKMVSDRHHLKKGSPTERTPAVYATYLLEKEGRL